MYSITDGSDKYQVSLKMELDTGSVVSIVNETTYREKFSDRPLRRTNLKLQDYNKAPDAVLGVMDVPVVYKSQSATLPLVVTKGDRPNLFGRNWLSKLKLGWNVLVQQPRRARSRSARLMTPQMSVVGHALALNMVGIAYPMACLQLSINRFKILVPRRHWNLSIVSRVWHHEQKYWLTLCHAQIRNADVGLTVTQVLQHLSSSTFHFQNIM